MFTASRRDKENYAALGGMALGLAISVLLAPKHSFFLPNFAFFWLPQLAVLAIAGMGRARAAILAGVAWALALHLAAFGAWVFSRAHPDSMAWLIYIFSLPGAVVGALGAAALLRRRADLRPWVAGAVAATMVLGGIGLNQAAICSTLMYCLGT